MNEVKDCVVTLCLDLEDMKALISEAGTQEVHKALGYAVSYGAIGEYEAVTIRRERAAGTPWNTLIQRHGRDRRVMHDAVRGAGTYKDV